MLPLWDDEPHQHPPVATTLLIAINVAVFAYEMVLAVHSHRALSLFIDNHALVARRLVANPSEGAQWLTVLTSMFLHGGVAHVLGNCWFLWVFGNNIEDRLGPVRFVLFYLLCGTGAAALQVVVYPEAGMPMLGASGAISGVLGAYLILYPFAWVYTLVPWFVPIVPLPAILFLLVWFGMQALNGVGSLMSGQIAHGGVAWWAHAGGFVSGIVLIIWARKVNWLRKG